MYAPAAPSSHLDVNASEMLNLVEQRPRRYLMNWIADLWTFFTRQQIDRNSSMFQDVFEIAASRCVALHCVCRDNFYAFPPRDTHKHVITCTAFKHCPAGTTSCNYSRCETMPLAAGSYSQTIICHACENPPFT